MKSDFRFYQVLKDNTETLGQNALFNRCFVQFIVPLLESTGKHSQVLLSENVKKCCIKRTVRPFASAHMSCASHDGPRTVLTNSKVFLRGKKILQCRKKDLSKGY